MDLLVIHLSPEVGQSLLTELPDGSGVRFSIENLSVSFGGQDMGIRNICLSHIRRSARFPGGALENVDPSYDVAWEPPFGPVRFRFAGQEFVVCQPQASEDAIRQAAQVRVSFYNNRSGSGGFLEE